MATTGGANITVDGLVFGYDTGYPLVSGNSDTYKFNRGEPTANALNGDIIGTGNGASLGSDDFGDYIQLADITSSYSRLQLPNITVNSNDTYTWTFELYSDETISRSGNKFYFDTNEYSDQFPSSNDLSRLSSTLTYTDPMPAGKWVPYKLRVTMKDNLTGAFAYDFFNFTYPTFQNKKIYYRNMQVEFKDHQTPYVGQGGVRSVSGSLIDLTRTTDIDLSNVSFDSNAQMTFDGTDDWLNIPVTLNAGNFTYETVIKQYGSSSHNIFSAGTGNPSSGGTNIQAFVNSSGGRINLYAPVGGSGWEYGTYDNTGNFTATNNVNYHIVVVNLNTTWKIYVNGDLVGDIDSFVPTVGNSVGVARAAMQTPNSKSSKVSLTKIYNRALTAQEVLQNYNAVKERFSL